MHGYGFLRLPCHMHGNFSTHVSSPSVSCSPMKTLLGVDPYYTLLRSHSSASSRGIPAYRGGPGQGSSGSLNRASSGDATAVHSLGPRTHAHAASDCGSDCGSDCSSDSSDFLEPLVAAYDRLPSTGLPLAFLSARGLPGMGSMLPSAADTRRRPQSLVRDAAAEVLRGMQSMVLHLTQRFGRRGPQSPVSEGPDDGGPRAGNMATEGPSSQDTGLHPQLPCGGSDGSGSGSDNGSDSPLSPMARGGSPGMLGRDKIAEPWGPPRVELGHGGSAADRGRAGPQDPMMGTMRRTSSDAGTMRGARSPQPLSMPGLTISG